MFRFQVQSGASFGGTLRVSLRAIILTVTALACYSLTAQDKRPLVAVLEPATSVGLKEGTGMLAAGIFEQALLSSKKFRFVDRALIDQTLKEHSIARENLFDNSTAKELGKMVQADIVCASELQKAEDQVIVRCKLINIVTGEVFASAIQVMSGDSYTGMQKGIELASGEMVKQSEGMTFTNSSEIEGIAEGLTSGWGKKKGGEEYKIEYKMQVSDDKKKVYLKMTNPNLFEIDVRFKLLGSKNMSEQVAGLKTGTLGSRIARTAGLKAGSLGTSIIRVGATNVLEFDVLDPSAPVVIGELIFTSVYKQK